MTNKDKNEILNLQIDGNISKAEQAILDIKQLLLEKKKVDTLELINGETLESILNEFGNMLLDTIASDEVAEKAGLFTKKYK